MSDQNIITGCWDMDCLMCSGEACNLCGAGCWSNKKDCAHDVLERHEESEENVPGVDFQVPNEPQRQRAPDSVKALIQIAAAMLLGRGFISPIVEDLPKTTGRNALARQSEAQRERLRLWAISLSDVAAAITSEHRRGVDDERERCARIAESFYKPLQYRVNPLDVADAIRGIGKGENENK